MTHHLSINEKLGAMEMVKEKKLHWESIIFPCMSL